MDNNKKASSAFNRVAKGALAGAGIAVVGAAILPVVTVSAPVVIAGAAIGAWLNSRNKP